MKFQENNQFWKLRSKHGRNPIFDTSDKLLESCLEYFEVTSKRTIDEQNWVGRDGDEVKKNHPVPFTLTGLCIFIGMNIVTWHEYKKKSTDFSNVCTYVEDVIYTQKFEHAATGFFNANIIARDLGLKDKQEIDHKSPQIIVNSDQVKKEIDKL